MVIGEPVRVRQRLPLWVAALAVVACGTLTSVFVYRSMMSPDSAMPWFDPERSFRQAYQAKLGALARDVPLAMEVARGDRTAVIATRGEIHDLLTTLAGAEPVARHHSHPEDVVALSFRGVHEVYLLGRDSQRADEYWLQLRDTDKNYAFCCTIVLFESKAVTSWLGHHAPR